jgi:hypothetical protein
MYQFKNNMNLYKNLIKIFINNYNNKLKKIKQ